jgi:hypothetical protein
MRHSLIGLSVAFVMGCAIEYRMTPDVVHRLGTHAFDAPYAKVFAATVAALRTEGFPIASSDIDAGTIRTGPKSLGILFARGDATGPNAGYQYVVSVTKAGDATIVAAEPHLYEDDVDVSGESRWNLGNPEGGEQRRWRRLFADIQSRL